MKNNYSAVRQAMLVACGLAASAMDPVYAQSSVTLYGIVDDSLFWGNDTSPGGNVYGLRDGVLGGSRWGLKGSEDIGGGVHVVFQLENGFSLNKGTMGNAEFGRQAYVGVNSNTWGALTLGRQYTPDTDVVQPLTGDAYLGGTFATPGDIDNYDNSIRLSNAVKYTSPTLNGVKLVALYAAGNQAGSLRDRNAWGAALSYGAGPFSVAVSYSSFDGGRATGIRTFATTTSDSIFNSGVNAAYVSAASIKVARVAVNYRIGSLALGGSYSNSRYTNDGQSAFQTTETYNAANAVIGWQLSPALLGAIGYSYLHSSGDSSAIYNQINAGTSYLLSKRTKLYLVGAWQHASGRRDAAGDPATASVGSTGLVGGGSSQAQVTLGIRHSF
ncbi:putative porin [Paraburkholderia caballeronis]|uniref:porin n=1 Tax=Paraburkholderia caballeronis TaxID=416943 RepID=UPI0010E30933|nr:porin [Paraburkholderia caballeronis]TDV33857.1 putative porin [Paraburkholderia caballeronis]